MSGHSLVLAARRSLTLARNANRGLRALNLQQPARSTAALAAVTDWSKLLDALEADVRPLVVTSRAQPFHIVAVNDSWTNMCGYSHAEALGKSLEMLQGPSTDRRALAQFSRQLAHAEAGDDISLSVVNYTKDRRAFLNEVHVTPVDVAIDGGVTPMFVGALSFKRWCPIAEEAAIAEAAAQAAALHAPAPPARAARTAHYSVTDALARSGAVRAAAAAYPCMHSTVYNVAALGARLAF